MSHKAGASPPGEEPPAGRRGGRGRAALGGLALLALAAVAHGLALGNPFAYDDLQAIVANELLRDPAHVPSFFAGRSSSTGFADGQFRPLVMLSFAATYAASGAAPLLYRLTNLLLHAANAGLVALVLARLLRAFPLGRGAPLPADAAGRAAFFGAALFAVHPVNDLVVLLVWKRATALAALFGLAALLCFLRLRAIGDPPGARPPRRTALWAGLLAGSALALGSKEVAIALPPLFLLVDVWPRPGAAADRGVRPLLARHAPLFAWVWGLALAFYPRAASTPTLGPLTYLYTQAKVVPLYVALALDPRRLSAVYEVDLARGIDPPAIAGAIGIALALGLAIAGARRAPLPGLAIVFFFVALAPTSSLFPIPLLVDEDRLYLPLVLLFGLAGAALVGIGVRIPGHARRVAPLLVGLALVAPIAFSIQRAELWASRPAIWLDALEKHPGSRLANDNLCADLMKEPDALEATAAACGRAIARFPRSVNAREVYVDALARLGRLDEAAGVLEEGLALHPGDAGLLRLAGHLAWTRGRMDEAIARYRAALRAAPGDLEAGVYLARSLREAGRADEARALAGPIADRAAGAPLGVRVALASLLDELGWRARACAAFAALPNPAPRKHAAALAQLAAACGRGP
jgi:tetratricopeptide (TPR) repeat protein